MYGDSMRQSESIDDLDKDCLTQSVPRLGEPTPLVQLAAMAHTPTERKVAEYLLSLPEAQRGNVTTQEVVERTGSSRSTLDRVARKLGYPGFTRLRRALVAPSTPAFDDALDPTISEEDQPETVAWKVLASVSSRMRAFAEALMCDNRVSSLVDLLDNAPHIVLCGSGLSAMVAMDLHHRLLRLGLNVNFSEDDHTQLAYASLMEAEDVALCISYSGRTDTVVEVAQIASARGICVALTADTNSPLARCAQLTVTTPPGVGLFGNDAAVTRILQMTFNDVLFHCLLLRNSKRLASIQLVDNAISHRKMPGLNKRPDNPAVRRH
jgi:DNA-binding MurR/RpiR family transcriptional regulator